MLLSDISIKRPVFASVINLLLITFGLVAFDRLPLREYPDIDPPVVSVETTYRGAAAQVVESRITQIVEDSIAGIEGIETIESSSRDGRATVTIEFSVDRNIDDATNDVRDRVSTILRRLPDEADPPTIRKVDANADPILWLNLTSDRMSKLELTDYARRYLEDRFATLDGVAQIRVGGAMEYSMRVWLDRQALTARNLTVADVENALRAENVELPAGSIESATRHYTVRTERAFATAEDFGQLVLRRGEDGYLVRLADIARVEIGPRESRTLFRGNGIAMVGIGIVKQSTANTLDVARAARAEAERLNPTLPDGLQIVPSYDRSVFIERAVHEVYITFAIAIALVILVIYAFLGSLRATLVPAVAVPVSIIATFILLYPLGFTVNLLTLLALILAIGLVVDDGIVVLENIHRRLEGGETPMVAAYRGTRQVGFAVIATTLVLIAVFVPISFLQGDIGRLFAEFAITMAVAVGFSGLVALTLSPMLASLYLKPHTQENRLALWITSHTHRLQARYRRALEVTLNHPRLIFALFAASFASMIGLFFLVPPEFAPREDRGVFFIQVDAPEGASFDYIETYMQLVEERLMPMTQSGEIQRLLIRAPASSNPPDLLLHQTYAAAHFLQFPYQGCNPDASTSGEVPQKMRHTN